MKSLRVVASLCTVLLPAALQAAAQIAPTAPAVTVQGLRNSANKGSFKAAQFSADGSLILLYDQGDGVRLMKTDASANVVSTQAQTGAAGDSGVAMALDPSGNIYVTGTSLSGMLSGSSGAAFPSPVDSSTNSFLAKFDTNLHLIFLTFLGADRTAAAGVAATSDAVFVTGVTYSSSLPVTPGAMQQTAATGSYGNGFVERFRADGSALSYATYLTGTGGDTQPAGIAVNSADKAFVTGETSATGYPTLAPLQPAMIGSTAGFLSELTPAGNAFVFSTFIAGSGLTGLALDGSTNTLLLSGQVSLGDFPLTTVSSTIANTPYQTLLRLSADGQTLEQSVLLLPGTQSSLIPGPNGSAWVSGTLAPALLPEGSQAAEILGDSFLLHVTQAGVMDQLGRIGGVPTTNAGYATLSSSVGPPALSADGRTLALPGTLNAMVSASLAATQHFDLALSTATTALPGSAADLLPNSCTDTSQCAGSGGLLTLVNAATASGTTASLSASAGDLPNVTVRNRSAATVMGLAVTVTGFTTSTDCGVTLAPFAQCGIALSGTGPGSVSISASNAAAVTVPVPATGVAAQPLTFSAAELDYGVVTADSSPVNRTVTITNLSGTVQSFASAADGEPTTSPYALAETGTTCGGQAGAHTVAANSSCTLTLGLSASSVAGSDGPVHVFWKIGARDLAITGFTEAAALSISAPRVDFGLHLAGSVDPLPRFVYLSNHSNSAVAHALTTLPVDSPFTVTDACPSLLESASVCQIALTYTQTSAPNEDSATLPLDDDLSVLVTGETLAPQAPGGVSNAALSVSSTALTFAAPVLATEISSETQVLTVTNTGKVSFPLAASVTDEFRIADSCGQTLNAGASCDLVLQFAPSQPGVREGLLSLATGSGVTPLLINLSGVGTALLASPNGTLSSGQTPVGEPAVTWYKVQTAVSTLTASVTGASFGVAIVEDDGTGPGTLPEGAFATTATASCANCWLGIQFLPNTAGPASAALTLSSAAGGNAEPFVLVGSGVATQGLILTADDSDFGTVPLGSSTAPVTFTLANLLAPATAATITGVTATGDFSVVANTTGGAVCTGSLASTASCYIEVSFTPKAVGQRTGTLTVQTSAGVADAPLTGSAVASPGLALNPTALVFSSGAGSAATAQVLTLTNTGPTALAVGTMTSSDPSFTVHASCSTLVVGASCTAVVDFTPGDAEVTASLSIPISTAVNGQPVTTTYTVPLSGSYTGGSTGLLLLPGEADYGAQVTGQIGSTRQFTLKNTSSQAETVALTVPAQFPLAAPFTCGTLPAGASCTFSVSFLPETGGALTGSLQAVATATDAGASTAQAIGYLLGYGKASGSLTISGQPGPNAPVSFGNVVSGQNAQQTLTLTNSGSATLSIRRIVSTPPFPSTNTCGNALAAGSSCTITITYAPVYPLSGTATSIPRADIGSLEIQSDAASSPDLVGLTGTSTSAAPSTSTAPSSAASYNLSEGALTFANTQVGDSSASQTIVLSNSGTQTLTFGGLLAPPDFTATTTCATVLPGASCEIQVRFTPGSASTASIRANTLEIESNAANSLEMVSLLGMSLPAPLTLSPGALDFGTVDLPGSGQLSVNVMNTASLPIVFGQLGATGDFSATTGTCPAPGSALPAGQSCTLDVSFTPSTTGTRTGLLDVATNATQSPLTVSLTGVGAEAKLQVSPGALDFGEISVGASAVLPLNLSNTGSASLAGIASVVSGANATDFAVTTPCPTEILSPVAGCTMQVTFNPTASGARSATLTITSSDPSGPVTIPLSGTGTQPGSVLLTVGGGTSATVTVAAGMPASYPLMLTPQNGFAGMVALTCTPLAAAPYAGCSLLSSQINLNAGAQAATATITTVNGAVTSSAMASLGLFLLAPLSLCLRRRGSARLPRALALACLVLCTAACFCVSGCGGPGNNGLNLTPAGSYKYQVTASSVSGTATSSTVTLDLIVQ